MFQTDGPLRTPLHQTHLDAGGRIVDFAGWRMPIQYQGIVAEHKAVRSAAGIFDVSHMGQLRFQGPEAASFLGRMVVSAVDRLKPGEARYTHLCDERANLIDDLIVYRLAERDLLLVPNAAMVAEVREWFEKHLPAEGVTMADESLQWVCLAVQGPRAEGIISQVTGAPAGEFKPFSVHIFPELFGGLLVARTGYTGEWGVELMGPWEQGVAIWETLMAVGAEAGLVPCGLGARDTLRLEKGYLLSGQDFDHDRTSLETACGWLVDWDHDFVGKEALAAQKEAGFHRLTGIKVLDRGMIRPGNEVLHDGQVVGKLTSGGLSVTLKHGIGLAYLPLPIRKPETPLTITVRGKPLNATTVKLPFL